MSDKDNKELCIVCAWRGVCRKQFALKAGQRCQDFSEDLTVKEERTEGETK